MNSLRSLLKSSVRLFVYSEIPPRTFSFLRYCFSFLTSRGLESSATNLSLRCVDLIRGSKQSSYNQRLFPDFNTNYSQKSLNLLIRNKQIFLFLLRLMCHSRSKRDSTDEFVCWTDHGFKGMWLKWRYFNDAVWNVTSLVKKSFLYSNPTHKTYWSL